MYCCGIQQQYILTIYMSSPVEISIIFMIIVVIIIIIVIFALQTIFPELVKLTACVFSKMGDIPLEKEAEEGKS